MRDVTSLRHIGSWGQTESKFAVVPSFHVVLRETLSDLAGGTSDNRVLIGIVVRLAIEHVDAERALFQAIKAASYSGLDDMPKETATFLASAKLRTFQNPFEFG